MIIPDYEIRKLAKEQELITPYSEDHLQPCSYDLTLGEVEKELLVPGSFVLACTREFVKIPDFLLGRLDGKSTLGRRGILIHATAGFIDPGFKGQIVLEIKNIGKEYVNLRLPNSIAQISFEELKNRPEKVYGERNNHYQNQTGIVKARWKANE